MTPDGQTITAKPPAGLHGHHYGPMLQAYALHQYHGCSVTQPELLDWLWDIGISISRGQLSQLLTQRHEQFHAEKDELLATGIRCSSYIQTDDTGTRHKGKNGYCTIINNESFAWFESTDSQSRENFVSLLHRPWSTYSFTDDALMYLEKLDYPKKWLRILKPYRGVTFLSHEAWEECIKDLGLTGKRRQQASEAMIYGSLIQHGTVHLTTFSDGARQYDVFKHSQLKKCNKSTTGVPGVDPNPNEQWASSGCAVRVGCNQGRAITGSGRPELTAAQQPERESDTRIC